MFRFVQMKEDNLQLDFIHQLEVQILINQKGLCKCQKMTNHLYIDLKRLNIWEGEILVMFIQ